MNVDGNRAFIFIIVFQAFLCCLDEIGFHAPLVE